MRSSLALVLPLLLAACAQPTANGPGGADGALSGAPDGPPVAVVNGEAISEPLLVAFARSMNLDPGAPDQRQVALERLVDNVVLAQAGLTVEGTDATTLRAEATLARVQAIANRVLAARQQVLSADDAQVADLYEREKQRAGDTEWRSQHILFTDKAAAEAALQRALAPGADFDALVAEYANGGARQSRELAWAHASQLPEALSKALRQLEDGEVAPLVLESNFGFHVLRRLEARPFTPPPFEQVREGARRQLIEQGMRDYVAGLRAKAEVSTGATQPGG